MINVDHNPVETEEGVWAPAFKGVEFRLAHVSSMKFQKKLARLQQPHAKKIEKGTLPPDVQKDILCQAMSGTIVLDWRGKMVNSANEPIPFAVDTCTKVLNNHVDVRDFITGFADNLDHFRTEETDELGNAS